MTWIILAAAALAIAADHVFRRRGEHFVWLSISRTYYRKPKIAVLWEGRSSLRIRKPWPVGRRRSHFAICSEWGLGPWMARGRIGASLSLGGDETEVGASVRIPWVMYLHLSLRDMGLPSFGGREVGLFDFSGIILDREEGTSFALELFKERDGAWRSADKWWQRRRLRFAPADFFLGHPKYKVEDIGTEDVVIPMPEGCYPAVVTFKRRTWRRPRWPFATVRDDTDISCDKGVPFPGKGENAWDCGMDALCGTGVSGHSAERAVGQFVTSVLESRRKYGGKGWKLEAVPS